MAIQIIAWMASGLYFSLVPITEIRGEHLTSRADLPLKSQLNEMVSPAQLASLLNQHFGEDWILSSLELINIDGQNLWRIQGEAAAESFTRLIAPDGRNFVPRLSGEEAKTRAMNWLKEPVAPVSSEWVETVSEDSEFRGRALPVWRVRFSEPESLSLYLDPWTGELLARRTDRWRIFDFLWMLHIMDFDGRDDFNHPLLQVAAALGLIIALSGVIFWAMTTRIFRRRRKPETALSS